MPYDFSTFVRDCSVEQEIPISGNVSGTIPTWLRGSLILNGPGKMTFGEQEYRHFFDGAAILQKINFSETGATYSSQFLRSNAFLLNSENDQIVVSEFATKGTAINNKTSLQKLKEKFKFDKMFSDNASVNVVRYGNGYYAVTESPYIHRIDTDNLRTVAKVDLHKELGVNSQCPHPIYLNDGSCINVFHNLGPTGPKYDVLKFPAQKSSEDTFPKPTKIISVDARWKLNPCLIHSFAMTENYIIIPEQPLTIDVKSMVANTVKEKPFVDGMEWMNEKLVKFHIVCLKTGKDLKYRLKSESFFYLHIINSYEVDNFIIIDLCTFQKPDMLEHFYLKTLKENGETLWKELDKGSVKRIVLPTDINEKTPPEENLITLKGITARAHRQKDGVILLTPEDLTPICYENPTMHEKFVGQQYDYFYGASSELEENCGKVAKVDVRNGAIVPWSQSNMYACTLSFIPKPRTQSCSKEDDGVVLVTCLHGGNEKRKISVAVLDAADMNELGLVTFGLQSQAPRPIHATFVNDMSDENVTKLPPVWIMFCISTILATTLLCCTKKNKHKSAKQQKEELRAIRTESTTHIERATVKKANRKLSVTIQLPFETERKSVETPDASEKNQEKITRFPKLDLEKSIFDDKQPNEESCSNNDETLNNNTQKRRKSEENLRENHLSALYVKRGTRYRRFNSFNEGKMTSEFNRPYSARNFRTSSPTIQEMNIPEESTTNWNDNAKGEMNKTDFSRMALSNLNLNRTRLYSSMYGRPSYRKDVLHPRRFSGNMETPLFSICSKRYKEPYSRDVRTELNEVIQKIHKKGKVKRSQSVQTQMTKPPNSEDDDPTKRIKMKAREKDDLTREIMPVPEPDYNVAINFGFEE